MARISMSAAHVRSLKNALRDRFPNTSSSHLSEALASALGFNTNIAFVTATKNNPLKGALFEVDSVPFLARLAKMGCPLPDSFSFADIEFGNAFPDSPLPDRYRANIARMLALEGRAQPQWAEINRLRQDCARMFAERFELGLQEPRDDDKALFKRWNRGVDSKCQPGWGRQVNYRHPTIDFPGTDHQARFIQRLPLSNGKHIQYASALVSMPYIDSSRTERLEDAAMFADSVGWSCEEMPEWAWYAARGTTLVLFKRKTSHAEIERMWETSFKRWLIENKSTLTKSASSDRRRVILDAINCQHLPLDLRDFEDCRERYLKEFAGHLYLNEKDSRTRAFRVLIEKWQLEKAAC